MQNFKSSLLFALTMLLLAMVSIQSGAALAKHIFPQLGPNGVSALRLGFAAAILCAIWKPWRKKLNLKTWKAIFAYGLALGSMNLFFYLAIARIPLGIAVALEFAGPLAVALIASRSTFDFLWAILAGIGIYLILPITESSQPLDVVGIVYAFLAAACWGFYIYFGHKAAAFIEGGLVTSLGMLVAALLVLPVGMIKTPLELFTPMAVLFGFGVAIFSSALPYSLEMVALKKISKKKFGILMSVEPAIAALSGFVFLREKLTPIQWCAIILIILASVGTSLSKDADNQRHSE